MLHPHHLLRPKRFATGLGVLPALLVMLAAASADEPITSIPLLGDVPELVEPVAAAELKQSARRTALMLQLSVRPKVAEELVELYRLHGVRSTRATHADVYSLATEAMKDLIPRETIATYFEGITDNDERQQAFEKLVADKGSVLEQAAKNAPDYVRVLLRVKVKDYDRRRSTVGLSAEDKLPISLTTGASPLRLKYEKEFDIPDTLPATSNHVRYLRETGAFRGGLLECHFRVSGAMMGADGKAVVALMPVGAALYAGNQLEEAAGQWLVAPPKVPRVGGRGSGRGGGSARGGGTGRGGETGRGSGTPVVATPPQWLWNTTTPIWLRLQRDPRQQEEQLIARACIYDYFVGGPSNRWAPGVDHFWGTFSPDYVALRDRSRPLWWAHCETNGLKPFAGRKDPPEPAACLESSRVTCKHSIMDDIFHGRFEEIRRKTNDQWEGDYERLDGIAKIASDLFAQSLDYGILLSAYVSESAKRYGKDQPTSAIEVELESYELDLNNFTKKNSVTASYLVTTRLHGVWLLHREGIFTLLTTINKLQSGTLVRDALAITADVNAFCDAWPKGSAGHAQLIENLARYGEGTRSLQEVRAAWGAERFPDQFFPKELYDQLRNTNSIAGRLVSEKDEGRSVSRQEIAEAAVAKLSARAAALGIAEHDVTRAMLEGRLSLDRGDLRLAFEGMARKGDPVLRQQYEKYAVDEEGFLPTDNLDEVYAARGPLFLDLARRLRWNEKFGSLSSGIGASTQIAGEAKVLTREDLVQWLGP